MARESNPYVGGDQNYPSLLAAMAQENASQAKPPLRRVSGSPQAMRGMAGVRYVDNGHAAMVPERLGPWRCAHCDRLGYVLVCAECRVACHGEWRV
jgi:hypothetical protein